MEIIDAYSHCGISKYKPIEDVRRAMAAANVSRAVLVQHLGEFDNSYIGAAVAADPDHFAGVFLVDDHDPSADEHVAREAATGRFRGIRLTTQSLSSTPSLFASAADAGLVVVLYAPDGIRPHVTRLEGLLEASPFTRLVVTHLGNPAVSATSVDESARDVFRLAQFSNVYLQLSGMKMFCPLPHQPLYPLIAEAVARFGAARIVWGSNYPVVGTDDEYKEDLQLLLDGRLPIPTDAISKIAGENAKRLWFAGR